MNTVALLLAAASVAYGLAALTRLPAGPLAMLAGLAASLSAGALGAHALDPELVSGGLELATTSLVLLMATQIEPHHAVGALIAVPDGRTLAVVAAVAAVSLAVRPLLGFLWLRQAGLTIRSAVEVLSLLTQVGELALVAAVYGAAVGALSPEAVGAIALTVIASQTLSVALSSDAATTWLARRLTPPGGAEAPPPPPPPAPGEILILGGGESGAAVGAALAAGDQPWRLLEADLEHARALQARGWPVSRADATDPSVQRAHGVATAALVVCTLRRPKDQTRTLELRPGRPTWIRVATRAQANAIEAVGGHAICEADLAEAELTAWLDALPPKPLAPPLIPTEAP